MSGMKPGEMRKPGRKARGINEVVGFLLILAVVIMTITVYMIYFMPTLGRDQEISQMSDVKERFAEFKLNIDSLWMTRQGTSSFGPSLPLGSGETTGLLSFFPFLRPPRAGAVLALNQRDENITITSDSYILGGGGSKVGQAVGTSPVLLSVNTTPSNLYIKLYSTDLLKERGVFVHGPTWDAWVNVTPNYIYTDPTSWTLNGTDITVTTLVGGRAVATSLPVYRSISSSTTYKVDLMNPVYGISPQFQNPQNLWLSASDGSGILASYEMQNSYTPMVSASTFPLGSIEFRSNNLYYTPQTHYYQLGGVFLEQDEGSTTEIPPDISISLNTGAPVVNVGEILLQGNAVTANMSGSGPITVTSQVTGIVNAPLMPGKNTRWVNLRIQAASPNAADMWNRTFQEIAARGGLPAGSYAAGSSGTIAYLNITGDPNLYTIQLSLTRVNIATDYILEYSPGGIARGWREGPGFPGQPGTDLTGCGDGTCNGAETCTTCPGDCGICPTCGDGTCNIGETCSSCPGDCGACPRCCGVICNGAETCSSCPGDCGACGGGGGGGGAGPLVINPCDWASRKKLTINGTMVSGTQTNFPVLVSLPFDSDLAASAQANGNDIVFTDSGGSTVLPHEIENFTKSSGVLVAWVKLPTLSNGVNTDIYMYFGNSSVTNQQNSTAVWDSDYVGVYHLKESGNGTAGEYIDSTYQNPGQGGQGLAAYVPKRVAGKIGYGQNFDNLVDGKWDLIDLHNTSSLLSIDSGNQITVEAWIQPSFYQGDLVNQTRGFINHKGWFSGYSIVMNNWGCSSPNCVWFGLPGQNHSVQTSSVVSKDNWHHVAGTYNGSWAEVLIDGQVDSNKHAMSATFIPPNPPFNEVWIGYGDQPTDTGYASEWWGLIDEVRISRIGRSESWIGTEYNNQNRPDLFVSRGTTGAGCGGGGGPLVINPCAWASRKKLTINGTMISGTQANFPVLVSLSSDSDLAAHAQASGNDIVFTDSGGSTVLPHEIENFTKSSGALVAWVRLPAISASVNTDIYLYYGNSSVGSQQNVTGVWDADFKGVWHLGELVTDNAVASGVHKDSTSYGNNGNQYNNSRVTGKIGDAQNFEGDVRDEFIEIPNSASTENLQEGDYSLEAWFNSDVTPPGTLDSDWNAYYGIVIKPGWHIGLRFDRWAKFDSDHYLTGGTEVWVGGVSGKSSSRWYHVVSVLNRTGGSHRIYVDGVEEDYATFTAGTAANEFNQVPWRLGIASTNNRGGNWEWPANGKIDEVRLSGIARSAQWIATEYANQNRPDLFISRGSGESPCGGGGGSSLVINPCDWASRKKLTINMSMVSGTQASFPVLVNLSSDADLANGTTGAQSSGNDIVFTDSGGTAVIPHEIENFTKSSGALLSWVKVPSISSGANTDIYMYFGNSTKPSQRNVTGVWDTNYLAVYHLNQDPSGTVIDSTGHANLSSEGTMGAANLVNAKIGKGIQPTDYSSTIDHLTSTNTVTVQSFTMEGWGDANNWYNWMSFVDVNTHAAGAYYRDHTSNPDADLYVDMANGITDNRQLSGVMATGLHHTVSRYNSSSQVLDAFVDGSTTGFSYSALVKPSLTGYVGVGAWSYYDTQLNWGDPFRGTLDEVRISNIARSDGWIQTGYNNQYRPHLFVSAGTREAPCGGGGSCSGVTVDTTSSGWAQAASGLTISHTASGSNRLMLVGVSIQDSDTVPTDTTDSVKVSSITYNGTVLTKVGSKYNADDAMVEIWKLIAPDTGTHNVVITLNRTLASQGFVIAGVTTFAGVDQTTPLGTFASQAGDDDNQINVTVSSATGEIAFGVIANEYNSIITDAGQTERWNIHKVGSLDTTNGAGSTKTGASSVLLKWTLSSTYNHWATAGISVKPCTMPTYTVNLQVGSMLDDCFRYFTNKLDCSTYHDDYVDTTSKDTTATTSTGLRFTSVAIPKNAAITKAYLTLRAASTSGSPGGGVIQGEASDNGAAFTEGAWSEFDGRTRTTNSVPWSPSAWSVGTDYTSPELKTVIQEIVNRAGWGSGNSMVLFI